VPPLLIPDYGQRLIVTTALTAVVWITVMLVTPSESKDVLGRFVQTVRPPGPGWTHWRQRLSVQPDESLSDLLSRFVWSSVLLFSALLGSGGFLLHQQRLGWSGLVIAGISITLLRRSRRTAASF